MLGLSRAGVRGVEVWRDVRVDLGTADGQEAAAAAIRDALGDAPGDARGDARGDASGARRWTRAVLINNAAIIDPIGVVGALDLAQVRMSAMINVAAPIALMSAFVAALDPATPGSVINISSGAGRRPIPGSGVYCATKAAIDMVSRTAVLELEQKQRSIVVTSLAPGIFETDMQKTARSKSEDEFPSVGTFVGFKTQNLLQTPADVAGKIIAVVKSGRMPAGIADLREL